MAWTPLSNIDNGTFEVGEVGQSFIPDYWDVVSSASLWRYAAFEGDDTTGTETFEGGWSSNEDTYDEYTIASTLVLGAFDAAEYDAEDFEDYEEGWESEYLDPGVQSQLGKNENYITEMVPTLGTFAQGDSFESFEAGWTWRHLVADPTNMDNRDISTVGATVDTANFVRGVMIAHFPSTTYHLAADDRWSSPPAVASDLATLITLVNAEYVAAKAHAEDSGPTWHRNDPDDLDVPDTGDYPATDLPTAQSVLAVVLAYFARHLWWRGNDHIWTGLNVIDLSDLDVTTKCYVQLAIFDEAISGETVEDFEEGWNSNQDTYDSFTVPTNLVLATFTGGSQYDSFETTRDFTNISTSNGGISDELEIDPRKAFYFEATFTGNATYRLQCQRSIGGAWISILEFTATTALEVPDGYRSARIYTVNHTTGTLAATVGWERLDIY